MKKKRWSTRLLSLALTLTMLLSMVPAAFAAEAGGDVTLTPDVTVEETLPPVEPTAEPTAQPEEPTVPETQPEEPTLAEESEEILTEDALAPETYYIGEGPLWPDGMKLEIYGDPHVGGTLTAVVENVPENCEVTWQDRSSVTEPYVVKEADKGSDMYIEAKPIDGREAYRSSLTRVPKEANEIGGRIRVTGLLHPGNIVRLDISDVWPVEARAGLRTFWYVGTPTVATNQFTYMIKETDVNKELGVNVFSGPGYSGSLYSGLHEISKAPVSGKINLSVNGSKWTLGSEVVIDSVVFDQPELNLRPQDSFEYEWLYVDSTGSVLSILGSGKKYLLRNEIPEGKFIAVQVFVRNWADYEGTIRCDELIRPTSDALTPINGVVGIKGENVKGATLQVDLSRVSPAWLKDYMRKNDPVVNWAFTPDWTRDGKYIGWGMSYVLTELDVGHEIGVKLSANESYGFTGELTSAPRGKVVESFLINAPGYATTEENGVIKVTKTDGTKVGTIRLTTWAGVPLSTKDIKQDTDVVMLGEPEPGYKFDRWEFRPLGGWPADYMEGDYQFGDQRKTSPNNPWHSHVSKLGIYSAIFNESAVVENPEVTLGNLVVAAPGERVLIQDNSLKTQGFDPNVLNYSLYTLKGERDLKLVLLRSAIDHIVKVGGVAADFTGGGYVSAPVPIDLTKNKKIEIVVADAKGTNTIYTVNVTEVTENPQMAVTVAAYPNRSVATLTVRIKQSSFLSGDFALTLKDDLNVAGVEGSGFAGFCSRSGVLLGSGNVNYEVGENYSKSDAITVDQMTISGDKKSVVVNLSSALGGSTHMGSQPLVVDNADGYVVLRLYALKTAASVTARHTNDQLLPAAALKTDSASGANTMYETRFGKLKYQEAMVPADIVAVADSGEAELVLAAGENIPVPVADRLVSFGAETFYNITLFVNGRPNENRMRYNLYRTEFGKEEKLTDIMDPLAKYGVLSVDDIMGDYHLEVISKGYLAYKSNPFQIVKKPVALPAVLMIAGDVNDDGLIDVNDRTDLIKVIGGTVVADTGSAVDYVQGGYVLSGVGDTAKKIYADLNDDGLINALDLGSTLRGIALMGK